MWTRKVRLVTTHEDSSFLRCVSFLTKGYAQVWHSMHNHILCILSPSPIWCFIKFRVISGQKFWRPFFSQKLCKWIAVKKGVNFFFSFPHHFLISLPSRKWTLKIQNKQISSYCCKAVSIDWGTNTCETSIRGRAGIHSGCLNFWSWGVLCSN